MNDKEIMATQLIEILNKFENKPRSYSGRAMYGTLCVAVYSDKGVWEIAQHIGSSGDMVFFRTLPEPDIDTLGQGFIVYWPTLPWVAVAPTLEDRVNEALDNAEVNKLYIVRKLLALADEILVEMRISNNGDNRKRVPELVLSQQGLTDVRKNIDDYLRRTE